MIFGLDYRKWTLFLWSLSGFISIRTPYSCVATTEEKGSLFVSDDNIFRRSYRLEDFFWTGSGDGPVLEDSFSNDTILESKPIYDDHFDTWKTTTVFHTTTILFATVYPNSRSCSNVPCKPKTSPVWTGSVEFSSPVYPSFFDIEPTPTEKRPDVTRNLTILSEVTKVLTVTERVTAQGTNFQTTSTTGIPHTIPVSRNATFGGSDAGEGSGAAYPRFDVELSSTTASFEYEVPMDQKYWLLTVLKRENYSKELKVHVIEEKLSMLYKKAFLRQQEKHLGINGNSLTTTRPRRDRRLPEPVRVHIHNVSDGMSVHPNGIGLLYSVTVAGKPVPALTAANDMKLITENEVVAELGFPILTKAEPFLKGGVPVGARIKGRTRDTWLLIGAVIAAVSLLIILAIVFTFGLSNRRESQSASRGTNNKKHVFEAEEGSSNLAFQEDTDLKVRAGGSRLRGHSAKFDSSRTAEGAAGTTVTFADQRLESSSSSSCSGSSEASLVRLRHQQKKKEQRKEVLDEKPRPRPRTRVRKVENSEETLEDGNTNRTGISSAVSRESYGGMTTEGLDDVESTPRLARTPPSYLSMPSVKAFPRGARIPEPLNRVLEPISIRYLDEDTENITRHVHRSRVTEENYETDYLKEADKKGKQKAMTRHASLEGDPGVIGPVVWKRQCLKADIMGRDVIDISEIDGNENVGKMRKRFNELIDDAFSVFGSKNDSPEDKERTGGDLPMRSTDTRIHSAVIRPAGSFYHISTSGRPKTTDSKRPVTAMNQGPRGAWDSPICITPSRTIAESQSIDRNSVLVDCNLSPSDPAIPLIKAIKDELQKFDHVSSKRTDAT